MGLLVYESQRFFNFIFFVTLTVLQGKEFPSGNLMKLSESVSQEFSQVLFWLTPGVQ